MNDDGSKLGLIMISLLPNSRTLLQLMFGPTRLNFEKALYRFLEKPLLSRYKRTNAADITLTLSLLPALNDDEWYLELQHPEQQ